MRTFWIAAAFLAAVASAFSQQPPSAIPPSQLVREVVYNELHDHDRHGYWRYWIQHRMAQQNQVEEQVETKDGPVTRLILNNGRPLDEAGARQERQRLRHLIDSPGEQARKRQEYAEDEKRIGRILALLPDAFVYHYQGVENGCVHLSFRPDPNYPAHSIEARIFHAMSGDLWIDARMKRLARLDGHLEENLDFGYGILGRLYKGGWFRLQRTAASSTDWKTERLEVHMNGRALLFKTIAKETSELRGGFLPVPAGMNMAQGLELLTASQENTPVFMPAVFTVR
jgi:hypothetical protein